MKTLAHFLVRWRKAILATMLILAVASACLMPFVHVNKDMTRYIPSYMQSKIGMDAMTDEFGDSSVFRMMFKGVPAQQHETIADALEDLSCVTSVGFDKDSTDYVHENAVLYEVAVDGGTYSQQALDAYAELQAFAKTTGYECLFDSAVIDAALPNLGLIITVATIILIIILIIMSKSWFEPVLLLFTLGVAIVLNMGTNVIFESVSDTTFSIAAIFQLVLSLDYSVMLMSRYRSERELTDDAPLAMENALRNAFGPVSSSSLTTIVGMVCLVLMSFTIGRDMGLVLAKGVLFSLLCVFTVMPALVVGADKILQRTKKKAFHPAMRFLAKASFKLRYVVLVLFALIFAGGFMLRNMAEASFVLPSLNADHAVVEQEFPNGSQVVILYQSTDEAYALRVSEAVERMDGVRSVSSYASTLGKQYTYVQLAEEMDMDQTFARLLYYYREYDGTYRNMTLNQFASLVRDDIASNPSFKDQMDDFDTSQLGSLITLTTLSEVVEQRTAGSMANFFKGLANGFSESEMGMTESQVQQLYLLFYMKSASAPRVETGKMTVMDFVNFLADDVVSSPELAGQFSEEDVARIYAMQYQLTNLDYEAIYALNQLASEMDMSVDTLLGLFQGLKTGDWQAQMAFDLYVAQQAEAAAEQAIQSAEVQQAAEGAAMQAAAAVAQMGGTIEMQEAAAQQAREAVYQQAGDAAREQATQIITASMNQYLDSFTVEEITQLRESYPLIRAIMQGASHSAAELASLFGMESDQVEQLLLFRVWKNGGAQTWTMSAQQLVNFLLGGEADEFLSDMLTDSTRKQLRTMQSIMNDGIEGTAYNPRGMYERIAQLASDSDKSMGDMDAASVELLYLYRDSCEFTTPDKTYALDNFVEFICTDVLNSELFGGFIDDEMRADILDAQQQIADGRDQLVGKKVSRMIVKQRYASESPEMATFLSNVKALLGDNFVNSYYLVGEGPMTCDMREGFMDELNYITLVTAAAIFLIVLLTFRNLLIPLLLVALIQGSFFWTMAINGLMGSPMYYVAIIIVQAVLMGATIDYAILYTSLYREARATLRVRDAIRQAYHGSVMTMLTSGTILVVVTFVLGIAMQGTAVGGICLTIAEGATSALILVMLVLPGVLAALDRWTAGKHALREK